MLCAALDGTLERYVRAQGDLDESGWWWAAPDDGLGARLVVKTRWWRRTAADTPRLMDDGQLRRLMDGAGWVVATIPPSVPAPCARAMQVAMRMTRLAASLAEEAFKLQMRSKCYDLDPAICEVNRLVEYVETGRMRNP